MKVTLWARTEIDDGIFAALDVNDDDTDVADADYLAEGAGRACYDSWDRPNPATRANADYVANIIRQQHESVLAHATATFYVTGVSRSLTHELVRHRFLAFSERSLRYVDAADMRPVYPPAAECRERARVDRTFTAALAAYEHAVETYEADGLPRKQAREAARAHLPLATETRIVVTGSHRAWRDMLRQRLSPHADREIRALAVELLRQLREIAPNTYADITPEAE